MTPSELQLHRRRMKWAVSSPTLLDLPECHDFCSNHDHLNSLLAAIDQCAPFERDQPNGRMGKYFEQLVIEAIKLDPTKELILSNLPILEGKITVGEIDLIIHDLELDEFQHWEIALKFYLQTKEGEALDLMIGPNAKDDLDRKIRKLFEKQLPLSDHLVVQEICAIHGIERLSKKLFLKGMFFYHGGTTKVFPKDVNPEHQVGWWIHLREMSDFLAPHLSWCICHKPDWIGPLQLADDNSLMTKNQMLSWINSEFESSQRSLLLIGMKKENDRWIEASRGFVVSDEWPEQANLTG